MKEFWLSSPAVCADLADEGVEGRAPLELLVDLEFEELRAAVVGIEQKRSQLR